MGASYEVQDNSILVAPLKRYVWEPLLPLIPSRVSANSLTLAGTLMSAVAFAITAFLPASRLGCAVVAVLVFGYLCLDNMDGAHARVTGTSSPLGEFLDHWLDALNLSFLFMGCVHTWEIPDSRAVVVMALAVMSYTMTFWEQRVTHRIHMARLGNVEGIVVVILFYVAGVIFGPRAVIDTKIIGGQTMIDFFWYSAIINTSVTSLGPILRVRRRLGETLEIAAPLLAIVLWYALGRIGALQACRFLMLMTPALAGRMLIARVTSKDGLGPDRFLQISTIVAASLSLIFRPPESVQSAALSCLVIYACAHVALDFVLTVRRLGDYLRPGELLAFARPRRTLSAPGQAWSRRKY